MEWCTERLQKLKITEDECYNALKELSVELVENGDRAGISNQILEAPEIYEVLDNREGEHFQIAFEILGLCLMKVSAENIFRLQRALFHKNPQVRRAAVDKVLAILQSNSDTSIEVGIPDEWLKHFFDIFQEKEGSAAMPVFYIFCIILRAKLDQKLVKDRLLAMLSCSEVIKCRAYQLAVELANHSVDTLRKCEFILDSTLAELDNGDILLQANILEILTPLAGKDHSVNYLEEHKVFDILTTKMEELLKDDDIVNRLLLTAIVKFFGKVAALQPERIISSGQIVQSTIDLIRSTDTAILPVALDSLANMALTNRGKILLERNYSTMMKDLFSDYVSLLRNFPSDLKNRAFNALEVIFTVESDAVDSEVSAILERWYSHLNGDQNNLQVLMNYIREPFSETKIATYSFLKAICKFSWGIVSVKNTAGLVEYLLDRSRDNDHEAKNIKFEVIELLADSSIFDVQTNIQLRTYVNEGPHYIRRFVDIAVEGN